MDKFWENYIKTRPANSKGAFDAFKKMNQEPRTMVAELTNMNTPDLEQSPDSFLRPGETLEDWDVSFRRPNADGGRIRLYKGESVVKAIGKQLIKLIEAGESSVSIANKFGLKQSTVNNALFVGSTAELAKMIKNSDLSSSSK